MCKEKRGKGLKLLESIGEIEAAALSEEKKPLGAMDIPERILYRMYSYLR